MRTNQTFTTGGEEVVLAVSLELAAAKWKVTLHDGRREQPAVHTVAEPQAAARLQAVLSVIERHKGSGRCRLACAPSSATRLAAAHRGPSANTCMRTATIGIMPQRPD
jgi:hypothetical protein